MSVIKRIKFVALTGIILISVSCEGLIKETPKDKRLIAQHNAIMSSDVALPIMDLIASDKGFSIIEAAIVASDFQKLLVNKKSYTIFAPLDQAFEELSSKTVENLLLPQNKERLANILKYHVIPNPINEKDILKAIDKGNGSVKLRTLGGKKLTATRKGSTIYLIDEMGNRGRLIMTDIEASNGYIHTIDGVMMTK